MLNATIKEIIEHYNNLFDNVLKINKSEKYEKYSLLCEDLSDGLARYTKFTNEMFKELLEGVLDVKLNENYSRYLNVKDMFNNYSLRKIDISNTNDLEKYKEDFKSRLKLKHPSDFVEGFYTDEYFKDYFEFKKIKNSDNDSYEVYFKEYNYETLSEENFEKLISRNNDEMSGFDR